MAQRLLTLQAIISRAAMETGIAQVPVQNAMSNADQDIAQMRLLLTAVADEVLIEEPYRRTLGDGVWLMDAAGNPKPVATDNTDVILIDGRLMTEGLKYRFLKAKGLEFGEELRDFTTRLNKLAAQVNARVLDLDVETERQL